MDMQRGFAVIDFAALYFNQHMFLTCLDNDRLEDLIAAAVNDAVRRGEALSQEKMSGFTAGLNLPPGFKLPF